MSETITPTAVAAARRRTAESGRPAVLKDPRLPGLQLRITPRGTATWSGVIRNGPRVRTVTFGRYSAGLGPDSDGKLRTLGLAAARDEWRRLAHSIRYQGADPVQERRAVRAQAQHAALTLGRLLELYGGQDGRAASWTKQLEPAIRRVFGGHIATALARLRPADLQRTVDTWPSAKSASFSLRALLTVFRWASVSSRRYVDAAFLEVRTTAAKPRRDRVVTRTELAAILPALRRARSDPYALAHELILLSACRRGEVANARWRDIDFGSGTWHLPHTKSGVAHTIPLSKQAVTLLSAVRPQDAAGNDLVLTDRSEPLTGWDAATTRLQTASATQGWSRHDLRRSSATLLAELGVSETVIKRVLNHAEPHTGVTGIYVRHRYDAEARGALQKLADLFDAIAAGGAEVHELRQTA